MKYPVRLAMLLFLCSCLAVSPAVLAENGNEATEPSATGARAMDLLNGKNLDAWDVPSTHWYLDGECIVGDTNSKRLEAPEWLYTKKRFRDFVFTCELRLSGDEGKNTGIYYRISTFLFNGHHEKGEEAEKPDAYEAPSGYEMDAFHPSGPEGPGINFWGSLGDWYKRPALRVFADQALINRIYEPEGWNRLTVRARGNRLEHWVNGVKVLDYIDPDPEASREGVIGLQIHDGSKMKVEYRNLHVLPLEPR